MSTSITADGLSAAQPAFLSKERIIAKPGFNRWLVPPAALAIHLCIGMAYGFSVFWLPLSKALGVTAPVTCAPDMSRAGEPPSLWQTKKGGPTPVEGSGPPNSCRHAVGRKGGHWVEVARWRDVPRC